MVYALPNVTSPIGILGYFNVIHEGILVFLLVMLFLGFTIRAHQRNHDLLNSAFSSSIITFFSAFFLYLGGILSGYIAFSSIVLVAVVGAMLYWSGR